MIRVGLDAKRIVRNGTGLGSYGRTLVNDLLRMEDSGIELLLYAPDAGRTELRGQIEEGALWRFPGGRNPGGETAGHPDSAAGGGSPGGETAGHGTSDENPGGETAERGTSGERSGGLLGGIRKAWWRSRGVVEELQRDGVTVYHGLSGELPIGLRKAGIKGIVTIHDLIFLRHPEYYHWWDVKLYAWKFRQALREAHHIIAISECTKRDIIAFGGKECADRIHVIYQSFSPRFSSEATDEQKAEVQARYGLPPRFILNVGTIERRKNLLLAVKALDQLPQDIHLVAVGRQTAYASELPKSKRLHLLSGVPDSDLAVLYQLAEVFVYPSRYEGFGIPIIEAIAAGLPVVACTGSCLEEAGGPDSLYIGPDDAAGMADSVKKMLRGVAGREDRIHRSREYIRRFEGCDVAGQVAALYRL